MDFLMSLSERDLQKELFAGIRSGEQVRRGRILCDFAAVSFYRFGAKIGEGRSGERFSKLSD